MAIARCQLIDTDTTPYYHIMMRCVRRAFLCGIDKLTGRDLSHRRQWVEEKIFLLAEIFAIDIASYAIMSNHYHLVLHIDTEEADGWATEEIFQRWYSYFKCDGLVQRYLDGCDLTSVELLIIQEQAEKLRERLMSISWFMKTLNESIARRANQEDNCTGKFFESRFKSQALLDDAALLTCMAYVDLNPIRAKMASSPDTSDFTSIKTRLNTKEHLLPFIKPNAEYGSKGIPFTEAAYFELVDWTGRCIRDDKRGVIPSHLPLILERINLTEHQWLRHTHYFEARFKCVAGSWDSIKQFAEKIGKRWFQGKPTTPLPN